MPKFKQGVIISEFFGNFNSLKAIVIVTTRIYHIPYFFQIDLKFSLQTIQLIFHLSRFMELLNYSIYLLLS